MSITAVHGYVLGFLLIGSWAVICGWSLALRFMSREESPMFWRFVSLAQILLVGQLVIGLVLLVMGRRPGPAGEGATLAFHVAYGLLFPLITLVVGHHVARGGRYRPHSVFSVVGLVMFGLMARAWMVGIDGA